MLRDPMRLHSRSVYLWVAFAIPAVSFIGQAVAPERPIFKSHDLNVVASFVTTLLVLLLWLTYRSAPRWNRLSQAFIILLLIAWLYQVIRVQLDQTAFEMTAFLTPMILLLVLVKSATARDLRIGLLVLGYSLLTIAVISLVFGALEWMPNGFEASDSGAQRIGLLDTLGLHTRWGGPFGSVNYASPIGGLLIVIGAICSRWHRIVLVIGGVVIIVLGQGRSAMLAVLAGVAIAALWSPTVDRMQKRIVVRVTGLALVFLTAVLYVLVFDPTLNGRTPIWSNFIGLVPQDPIFGIGNSGVLAFVGDMTGTPGFVPHTHAHSVLLDITVRFGIVLTLLTLAVFTVAFVAGARALRRGSSGQLALTVFVVVAGLTETIHSWDSWTVYSAALVWAVLSADRLGRGDHERAKPLGAEVSLSLHSD